MSDQSAGGPPPDDDAGATPPADRRLWIVIALLSIAVIVLAAINLFGGDDDGDGSGGTTTSTSEEVPDDTTTSSTSTSSTTSAPATTTSAPATTTTAAPPTTTTTAATTGVTADPAQCREAGSDPGNPDPAAQAVFISWTRGDEACARELMTDTAFGQLFSRNGADAQDDFQGCSESTEGDPHMDCAFTYPGGSTHYLMNFSPTVGWQVYEVYQIAH